MKKKRGKFFYTVKHNKGNYFLLKKDKKTIKGKIKIIEKKERKSKLKKNEKKEVNFYYCKTQ